MIRLLLTLLASLAAFAAPDARTTEDGAIDAFLAAELTNADDQEMFALVGGPIADEKQESMKRALAVHKAKAAGVGALGGGGVYAIAEFIRSVMGT